jgi:hypothetical protein
MTSTGIWGPHIHPLDPARVARHHQMVLKLNPVKPLLLLCAVVGAVLGIVTSCGPQQSFCPNNPPHYNCYDSDSAMPGTGGMGDNGPCDGGAHMTAQDGAITCL